jgi:signal transduction histidine kinase
MHTLIDAMLELSRTSTLPLQLTAVDLNRLLQRARDHLQPDLTGRSIRWDVHLLPTVMGDQKTLQQVMTNLLSNAVKYSRNEDVAHIRV